MRKATFWTVLLGIAVMGQGCATLMSKSQWPVMINSNPGGANVTIKDMRGMEVLKGTTPMYVRLPASAGFLSHAEYQIIFDKEGYYPATVPLLAEVNGWFYGNILGGGLIGILIDGSTGAAYELKDAVYGSLTPSPNTYVKSSRPEITLSTSTSQPVATSDDHLVKLRKLKELKEAKILTDEEYESKRKALVDKI